jgi:hypothetical protein
MDLTTMIKTASVVMTFLLVMSLNVDDGMLARTGFDPVFIFALVSGICRQGAAQPSSLASSILAWGLTCQQTFPSISV